MKKIFILFFTSLCCLSLPLLSSGVIIDRIVAVVNDDVITLSELEEAEYSLFNVMAQNEKGEKKSIPDRKVIKKRILDQFIEKKLQIQEADKLHIEVSDESIAESIKEIKDRNNIANDRDLEKGLALQGLTLMDLRRQLAERIKITKLVNRMVRARVQVNEDDILAYYRKHLAEYRLREEVHARHILLQVPEGALPKEVKKTRLRIEKIVADLENGADFAEMAKKLSEAPDAGKEGDMGYFKKGQMIAEIEQVVFSLKPGQRSGIVRSPFGFHIIEVLDRKEHTVDNDPALRNEIEDLVARKKTEDRMKSFLEELKKRAFINILEEK